VKAIEKILGKVRGTVFRYDMIRRGDRVIVALSGGPDSVCLLDILYEIKCELEIQLVVAHFDHGLRPEVDEVETQFTKSLAASLNLPFETEKAGIYLQKEGGSLEERARLARYRFLEQIKEKHTAQRIAIGHNLNDQAETVLMRLLRGSGPSGLSGIPPRRDERIIRPLIEISRGEIENYLEGRNLKYLMDASNLDAHYLRNRVRLELIPELKRYQPRIVEILGQMSHIMRSDDARLATEAESWVKQEAGREEGEETRIPILTFTMLPEALKSRVLRYVLKETAGSLRRIGSRHINAILQLASGDKPQARVNLPKGVVVKRVYNELVFTSYKDAGVEDFCYTIGGPGRFQLEAIGCSVLIEERKTVNLSTLEASPRTAFLNADRLAYPLLIRNFRPGDRFVPLGMTGHRKIKDFFIDMKIPSETRRRIPLLIYRDTPIWVCGFRIDHRFRVTARTKKMLKVGLIDNC
jgi:tRNA(Ile)-lysidine synthase